MPKTVIPKMPTIARRMIPVKGGGAIGQTINIPPVVPVKRKGKKRLPPEGVVPLPVPKKGRWKIVESDIPRISKRSKVFPLR